MPAAEPATETGAPDAGDAGAEAQVEAKVAEEVHGAPVTTWRGQRVAHVPRERLREVVGALRDEGWVSCLDVTGVDYLGYGADRRLPDGVVVERFEVVVTLISHRQRERLRLRVQVPAEDPVVPSLFELHPGTEASEREVFDMFGIRFGDHPDLSRILMPEDWIGHPLRKDFAVGRIPVQFKGSSDAR